MADIVQETTERLTGELEGQHKTDRDVIALIRTLLVDRERNGWALDVTPARFDDLGRALEETRQAEADLYEERRLSRVIREERDALAVLTGQPLGRVKKAEALLVSGQTDEPRTQVLARSQEDAKGIPLIKLTPQQQSAGGH